MPGYTGSAYISILVKADCANLYLQLQLLIQQGPLLQDLSLQLFFVLVQQCGQLGGILFGAFLLHHLLLLSLLSCLLLVLLNLVEDKLHHLVAHNHSKKQRTAGR